MKILIAVDSLIESSEQSNWAYNLASAFSQINENVSIFTPNQGEFVKYFDKWRVYSEYDFTGYNLIIVNGKAIQKTVLQATPPCKIFTSNLSPTSLNVFYPGADIYATSYEDDQNEKVSLNIPINLIRDPINFDKFKNTRESNETLKAVFYAGSSKSNSCAIIRSACQELKVRLFTLDKSRFDLEKIFNQVDLVIGSGRLLIEAMACERNVLSAQVSSCNKGAKDEKGILLAYGLIDPLNFDMQKETNFCGGIDITTFDKEILKMELAKYNKENGLKLREMAKKEYDYIKIAKQFISLYGEWKIKIPARKQKSYDPKDPVKIRI